MNDITIESDTGRVVSTEQWGDELFLTISDGIGDEYEAKGITLTPAQARKLSEWLTGWANLQEEKNGN